MQKLVIPSILAATVLIAGMFAFIPVDKASTTHPPPEILLASSMKITGVLAAGPCNAADVATDCDVAVNVAAGVPFAVLSILAIPGGTFTGNEVINPGALIISGATSTVDPAGATTTIPTIAAGGLISGRGIGANTMTIDMDHTIGTGLDTGNETINIILVMMIPGDAADPTLGYG